MVSSKVWNHWTIIQITKNRYTGLRIQVVSPCWYVPLTWLNDGDLRGSATTNQRVLRTFIMLGNLWNTRHNSELSGTVVWNPSRCIVFTEDYWGRSHDIMGQQFNKRVSSLFTVYCIGWETLTWHSSLHYTIFILLVP